MTAPSRRSLHTPSLPAWHVATSDSVRAILAAVYGADQPPTTIGDVTLMPHQRDALARVRTTIREFHGALLADEVGLGKTYVALALAHDYEHTHVVAPAALLPMWRAAIARTASQRMELHSLHAFSHTTPAEAGALEYESNSRTRHTLVIIDEAHHLRNRNTQRYQAISQFVAGRDLLLLSATPLHNTSRELRQLLALFTGLRDDLLTAETLARLIIRQTTTSHSESSTSRARQETPPRVHEHPPLRIPHDRGTLDGILALPSPLPARDGAVAGALIRLGLLRAWCSSDAALAHVIQRRLLRGEALKHALIAGRHPTQAELRTWLVGEHEVQLAFPELLAAHATESGPLLDVLVRHLDALQSLLDHHRRHHAGDKKRANALREIMDKHPNTPVIAFSQFTRTVQSLYRALSDIAGVGALTGMHAQIASGRIARLDALARFAPTAQGRPPPRPDQSIRLLLSTDILAEGVNLQDASVVVHLDLPWTDALRRQRVGRIARIGSAHDVVHVYSFSPPPDGDRALALTARLVTKSALGARLVGKPRTQTQNPPLTTPWPLKLKTHNSNPRLKTESTHAPAPADLATALHTTLHTWRTFALTHPVLDTAPPTSIPVAQLPASRSGWVAAVRSPTDIQLVAHTNTTGTEPTRIWHLVSAIHDPAHHACAAPDSASKTRAADATRAVKASLAPAFADQRPRASAMPSPPPHHVRTALRQLRRWLADRDIANSTGPTMSAASRAQTLARQRLAQVIGTMPPLARRSRFAAIRTAEAVIESAIGIGAESALEAWSRLDFRVPRAPSTGATPSSSTAAPTSAWLSEWRAYPALRRSFSRPTTRGHQSSAVATAPASPLDPCEESDAPPILALLILRTPPP